MIKRFFIPHYIAALKDQFAFLKMDVIIVPLIKKYTKIKGDHFIQTTGFGIPIEPIILYAL